jgi:hypothetical protein
MNSMLDNPELCRGAVLIGCEVVNADIGEVIFSECSRRAGTSLFSDFIWTSKHRSLSEYMHQFTIA